VERTRLSANVGQCGSRKPSSFHTATSSDSPSKKPRLGLGKGTHVKAKSNGHVLVKEKDSYEAARRCSTRIAAYDDQIPAVVITLVLIITHSSNELHNTCSALIRVTKPPKLARLPHPPPLHPSLFW